MRRLLFPYSVTKINDQVVTKSTLEGLPGKMKSRLSAKYQPITLEYPSDLYLRKWVEPYKERITSVPRNIYFKFWNKKEVVKGRLSGDLFYKCLRHWVYCINRPGWLHKRAQGVRAPMMIVMSAVMNFAPVYGVPRNL